MLQTALLFDIDGTLVDTNGAGRRAIEHAFSRQFGLDDVGPRVAPVHFAGSTDLRIFEELARVLDGVEAYRTRREALERAYLDALRERMAEHDPERRVLPGVAALLEQLSRHADTHLGLVTGNMREGARLKLEPFGLDRFFPAGGFGFEHADRREIARIAARRVAEHAGVSFPPSRVVVIGDTPQDVDCARANGFRAVAVGTGWATQEALVASEPDALLPDLADPAPPWRRSGWTPRR
jgi:phosphoglycolate phosphatase-like HAD superfamily hydrolase